MASVDATVAGSAAAAAPAPCPLENGSAMLRRGSRPLPDHLVVSPTSSARPTNGFGDGATDSNRSSLEETRIGSSGACALPASAAELAKCYPGAPLLTNDVERAQNVAELGKRVQAGRDSRFQGLAEVVCEVFGAPMGGVSLLDDRSSLLPAFLGLKDGHIPREETFDQWLLIPERPQILLVPDTLEDARFRDHPLVTENGVRFYVGAPLIASSGHLLGSLFLFDTKARYINVESCNLLCNFAEIAVRQLEKDVHIQDNESASMARYTFDTKPLLRPADCFSEALMLLSVTDPGWPVVYANEEMGRSVGCDQSPANVWDAFEVTSDPQETLEVIQQLAEGGCHFKMVAHARQPVDGRYNNATHTKQKQGGRQHFELEFRPAGRDAFATAPRIAIPLVPRMSEQPASVRQAAAASSTAGTATASGSSGSGSSTSDGVHTASYYFASLRPLNDPDVEVDSLPALKLQLANSQLRTLEVRRSHLLETAARWRATVASLASSSAEGELPAVPETAPANGTAAHPSKSKQSKSGWSMHSLDDVVIGPLLGRGSFGRVYKGVCHGRRVAVKVIDSVSSSCMSSGFVERLHEEGELTARLHHPNIVETLGYGTWGRAVPETHRHLTKLMSGGLTLGNSSSGSGGRADSSSPSTLQNKDLKSLVTQWDDSDSEGADSPADEQQLTESWVVMEYCNRGSLEQAVERGWFRLRRSVVDGPPDFQSIISTACEIAAAMAYLHSQDVVHGDLSAANVLLKYHSQNRRGFVTKVGDFGLSRFVQVSGSSIKTKTYGTVTHCPPERMSEGIINKATDVYSFGVLMWEMYHGQRAWAGMRALQIMNLLGTDHGCLNMPTDAPTPYKELVEDCLRSPHPARPTFCQLLDRLKAYRLQIRGQCLEAASPLAESRQSLDEVRRDSLEESIHYKQRAESLDVAHGRWVSVESNAEPVGGEDLEAVAQRMDKVALQQRNT